MYFNATDGGQYKFKLVWQEDRDGQSMTAFGNDYTVTGSVVVFHGCKGDIILPPTIKYIIK